MSYTTKFSSQWDNLVADFAAKIESTPIELLTESELNGWYQTRSYRWSSIAEIEAMMLEQEANQELRNELISAIADFKFEKPADEKTYLPSNLIVAGAIATVAAAVASKLLLSFSAVKAIIIALIIAIAFVVKFFSNKSSAKKTVDKKIRSAYIEQLQAYKQKLLDICNKYEK